MRQVLATGLLSLVLAVGATAQQRFSVQLRGTASGTNASGAASTVALVASGHTLGVAPAAGESAVALHARLAAAANTNGWNASAFLVHVLEVFASPSGPIADGLVAATDDTGLELYVALTPFDHQPLDKVHGVTIPEVQQGGIAAAAGQLALDFRVRRDIGEEVVSLTVPVAAGEDDTTINTRLWNTIAGLGLSGHHVEVANPLAPSTTVTGFGIERYQGAAGRVYGVTLHFDTATRPLFPDVMSAGHRPVAGYIEYGTATRADLPIEPWIGAEGGYTIGVSYDVIAQFGVPSLPGGVLVALDDGVLGFLGATVLMVPPWDLVTASTDASGEMRITLPLPPDPNLRGIEYYYQAFALTPGNRVAASSGLALFVAP